LSPKKNEYGGDEILPHGGIAKGVKPGGIFSQRKNKITPNKK